MLNLLVDCLLQRQLERRVQSREVVVASEADEVATLVWHLATSDDVRLYSPGLTDIVAANSYQC
jgi:hypothetical protein